MGKLHRGLGMALLTVLITGTAAFGGAAPPPNDGFANAVVLAASPVEGTTVGATLEAGEPAPNGAVETVWYRWTAPDYGTLKVSTGTCCIAVYTGTFTPGSSSLTPVGVGETPFQVMAGTTYHVQVYDNGEGGYPFSLSWEHVPGPCQTCPLPELQPEPASQECTAELEAGRLVVDEGDRVRLRAEGEPCDVVLGLRLLRGGKVIRTSTSCDVAFKVRVRETTRFRLLALDGHHDHLHASRAVKVRVRPAA